MAAMIILTWQLFRGSYLEVRQCCLDWNVAAITVRDGISTAARRGGEKGGEGIVESFWCFQNIARIVKDFPAGSFYLKNKR